MTPILVHGVIARLNMGGPAMHVVHLAEGLDPRRLETRLITRLITEDEGDMTYYARERGIDIVEIAGMSRLLSPWKDVRTLLTLFRRERPSIVHTHTAKAGTVGRQATLAAGVPVIVHTFHGHVLGGLYFSRLKTRFFLEIARQLAWATDRLVVLTHRQAREMAEDLGEARRRLRDQLSIEDDRPVIGIVGRMVPVKNHDLLFDAVGRAGGASEAVRRGKRPGPARPLARMATGPARDLSGVRRARNSGGEQAGASGVERVRRRACGRPGNRASRPSVRRDASRKRVLERYSIERLAGDMERLYTEALGRVGAAVREGR